MIKQDPKETINAYKGSVWDDDTKREYTREEWEAKVYAPEDIGNNQGWHDHDYTPSTLQEETFGPGSLLTPEQHKAKELLDKLNSVNPKEAMGALKAPMNACPPTALIELYAVMAGGAHKYGLFNFRDTEISAMTYIGAIRRHFMLWEDGQNTDEESGRSHLAHIMACCALALDAQHTSKLVDDRSKTGLVPLLLKDCARSHREFTANNMSIEERVKCT